MAQQAAPAPPPDCFKCSDCEAALGNIVFIPAAERSAHHRTQHEVCCTVNYKNNIGAMLFRKHGERFQCHCGFMSITAGSMMAHAKHCIVPEGVAVQSVRPALDRDYPGGKDPPIYFGIKNYGASGPATVSVTLPSIGKQRPTHMPSTNSPSAPFPLSPTAQASPTRVEPPPYPPPQPPPQNTQPPPLQSSAYHQPSYASGPPPPPSSQPPGYSYAPGAHGSHSQTYATSQQGQPYYSTTYAHQPMYTPAPVQSYYVYPAPAPTTYAYPVASGPPQHSAPQSHQQHGGYYSSSHSMPPQQQQHYYSSQPPAQPPHSYAAPHQHQGGPPHQPYSAPAPQSSGYSGYSYPATNHQSSYPPHPDHSHQRHSPTSSQTQYRPVYQEHPPQASNAPPTYKSVLKDFSPANTWVGPKHDDARDPPAAQAFDPSAEQKQPSETPSKGAGGTSKICELCFNLLGKEVSFEVVDEDHHMKINHPTSVKILFRNGKTMVLNRKKDEPFVAPCGGFSHLPADMIRHASTCTTCGWSNSEFAPVASFPIGAKKALDSCQLCLQHFKKNVIVKPEHYGMHHKQVHTLECVVSYPGNVIETLRREHGEKFVCRRCRRAYDEPTLIIAHCKGCNAVWGDEAPHSESVSVHDDDPVVDCELCMKYYGTVVSMKGSQLVKHNAHYHPNLSASKANSAADFARQTADPPAASRPTGGGNWKSPSRYLDGGNADFEARISSLCDSRGLCLLCRDHLGTSSYLNDSSRREHYNKFHLLSISVRYPKSNRDVVLKRNHGQPFVCVSCGANLSRPERMKEHATRCHNAPQHNDEDIFEVAEPVDDDDDDEDEYDDPPNLNEYDCEDCRNFMHQNMRIRFSDKAAHDLKFHTVSRHVTYPDGERSTIKRVHGGSFQCRCGRFFDHPNELQYHCSQCYDSGASPSPGPSTPATAQNSPTPMEDQTPSHATPKKTRAKSMKKGKIVGAVIDVDPNGAFEVPENDESVKGGVLCADCGENFSMDVYVLPSAKLNHQNRYHRLECYLKHPDGGFQMLRRRHGGFFTCPRCKNFSARWTSNMQKHFRRGCKVAAPAISNTDEAVHDSGASLDPPAAVSQVACRPIAPKVEMNDEVVGPPPVKSKKRNHDEVSSVQDPNTIELPEAGHPSASTFQCFDCKEHFSMDVHVPMSMKSNHFSRYHRLECNVLLSNGVHHVVIRNHGGFFKCPQCDYTARWTSNMRKHFKSCKGVASAAGDVATRTIKPLPQPGPDLMEDLKPSYTDTPNFAATWSINGAAISENGPEYEDFDDGDPSNALASKAKRVKQSRNPDVSAGLDELIAKLPTQPSSKDDYRCDDCQKHFFKTVFISRKTLQGHRKRLHQLQCIVVFSNGLVHYFLREHGHPFVCPVCSVKSFYVQSMQQHCKTCTPDADFVPMAPPSDFATKMYKIHLRYSNSGIAEELANNGLVPDDGSTPAATAMMTPPEQQPSAKKRKPSDDIPGDQAAASHDGAELLGQRPVKKSKAIMPVAVVPKSVSSADRDAVLDNWIDAGVEVVGPAWVEAIRSCAIKIEAALYTIAKNDASFYVSLSQEHLSDMRGIIASNAPLWMIEDQYLKQGKREILPPPPQEHVQTQLLISSTPHQETASDSGKDTKPPFDPASSSSAGVPAEVMSVSSVEQEAGLPAEKYDYVAQSGSLPQPSHAEPVSAQIQALD